MKCKNGKELIENKEGYWELVGEERKDFTYDHPVKELVNAVHFPIRNAQDYPILIRIINEKI